MHRQNPFFTKNQSTKELLGILKTEIKYYIHVVLIILINFKCTEGKSYSCGRVFLDKLTDAQIVKKFPALNEPVFRTVSYMNNRLISSSQTQKPARSPHGLLCATVSIPRHFAWDGGRQLYTDVRFTRRSSGL
jgi:hypothetical protein